MVEKLTGKKNLQKGTYFNIFFLQFQMEYLNMFFFLE